MVGRAACVVLAGFLSLALRPIQIALDGRALDEAVSIGQSPIESERARFHAPYRLAVARAPIDYLDVVTPFRRVVLAAEMRARLGDRRFGRADALKADAAEPSMIGIHVELTFHPFNTYVGVPGFQVELAPSSGQTVQPATIERVARFSPRTDGSSLPYPFAGPPPTAPTRSLPILGATVVAVFPGDRLGAGGVYDIVIGEPGLEPARVTVDFSRLR